MIKFSMTSISNNLDKETVLPITIVKDRRRAHICRGDQQSGKSFCHRCYIMIWRLLAPNKTKDDGKLQLKDWGKWTGWIQSRHATPDQSRMDSRDHASPHSEFKSLKRTLFPKKTLLPAIQPGACALQLIVSTAISEKRDKTWVFVSCSQGHGVCHRLCCLVTSIFFHV